MLCYLLLVVILVSTTLDSTQTLPIHDEQPEQIHLRGTLKRNATIDVKVLEKAHDLVVGRCKPEDEVLHAESFVMNNDGKSHLSATIKIDINDEIKINCVKILDKDPTVRAYPSYVDGGTGLNHISFNVTTQYGKGFKFFVEVMGLKTETEKA